MTRLRPALSLLVVSLAACNQNGTDFWLPKNNLLPMVPLDDRVAFVEINTQLAFVLDPADPTLTPRTVSVNKAPVAAMKSNLSRTPNQLLVLTKGDRGSSSVPAVPAELDVIDGTSASLTKIPLTGRFDAMAQSADGRFLLVYHSPSGQSQADSALYNPNEMTLVDFGPPELPATVVTAKTIRSMGGVPTNVLFSPPFLYGTPPTSHVLAVILSQNYVTIQDLTFPSNTEISVPLCATTTGCNLLPAQVVFDPLYRNIYVRVSGAKDIYQITLTDLTQNLQPGQSPPTPPENVFSASLSMLAVGATPADMALYTILNTEDRQPASRLAVASSESRSLVIIDPKTSQAIAVPTSIPPSEIVPFELPPLKAGDLPTQHALLVDLMQGSSGVIFADLNQVATQGGLALTDYPLGASAKEAHPLANANGKVVSVALVAGSYSGRSAITVVDLASRSFSAFDTSGPLGAPTFETRDPSRLWSVDQGTGLCYLNLAERADEPRMATSETWLDQFIETISPLPAASAAPAGGTPTRFMIVGHEDPNGIGNLTILDADHPNRANARAAYGFLLTNYLERKLP
jgi:hypothetical protein